MFALDDCAGDEESQAPLSPTFLANTACAATSAPWVMWLPGDISVDADGNEISNESEAVLEELFDTVLLQVIESEVPQWHAEHRLKLQQQAHLARIARIEANNHFEAPSFCTCPGSEQEAAEYPDVHKQPGKCTSRLCNGCHQLQRASMAKKTLQCGCCRMPLKDPDTFVPRPKSVCGCTILPDGTKMEGDYYCLLPERHACKVGGGDCQQPSPERWEEHCAEIRRHEEWLQIVAGLRREYRRV
mgnify:CR=1 FL=1